METRKRTRKDIVETISILCVYLEPDRLEQVWKQVFALAEEQQEAERGREKVGCGGIAKNRGRV